MRRNIKRKKDPRMNTLRTGVMLFGIAFLLTGCGSGNGGSVVATTTRAITTNTLKTFANGDNIQYAMTGSDTAAGATITFTGTGRFLMTTNASPPDLTRTVRSINTLALIGVFSNGTALNTNNQIYYAQDALGNFNVYGNAQSLWIISPASGFVTRLKSPIFSPNTWTNSYTQQNGDVTVATIRIIGKTIVTTGMGTFETYKIQTDSTTTWAAGGTDVFMKIDYVVPSIGPIKIVKDTQTTDAAGTLSRRQYTLIASTTNIAF
ncbi:MAG: hypothetical protein Q9M22_00470 [Mariprofundaceae bacterium]|nr:hypothetical protein [Mariprofundaceae bacterium]